MGRLIYNIEIFMDINLLKDLLMERELWAG
jgi:hypothetical protein